MITSISRRIFRYLKAMFAKISGSYPPPFEYVQSVTHRRVHQYLGCDSSEISSWCIVGGHLADEIATIKSSYPGAKITVFECSKRYLSDLLAKYASDSDVSIIGQAVSDQIGRATFFETNLVGSGSLLELGNLHKQSYGSEAAEEFEVQTTTLDGYFGEASIDVLQIDVQGAEKLVLEGGKSVLRSTKAVFLETSVEPGLYEQSTTFDELYEIMKNAGFKLALVGTDFNLTGNALFVRRNLPTSLEPISMRW